MKECEGKTVMVVGGTRGIGRATALLLAESGANVIATGRTAASGDELLQHAAKRGFRMTSLAFDVADPEATREAIDRSVGQLGRLDAVVVCAGISPYYVRAEHLSPAMWDDVMAVNLRGLFFTVQAAARHMLDAGSGSVVCISSVTAMAGIARALPYSASKSGVDALVRTLAVEWADRGVRVNAVAPGWIGTDMTQALRDNESLARWLVLDKVPMNRFGQPREIGDLISFLVSDRASFITGQTFVADGGFLAA
jgi:NAD(P)-dependent dehydrogenase (short-subunit alcohol dehydrogenase family)